MIVYLIRMVIQADRTAPVRAKAMPKMSVDFFISCFVWLFVKLVAGMIGWSLSVGNRAVGLDMITMPMVRMMPMILM